jgi:general secretion pathway protein G
MLSIRLISIFITASLVVAAFSCVVKRAPNANDARRRNAKARIELLSDRLQQYAEDHRRLPATLSELTETSGGDGPYAQAKDLLDPYGRAFAYIAPGTHGAFDLVFLGKDGKPGGDGYDTDVGNWELPRAR